MVYSAEGRGRTVFRVETVGLLTVLCATVYRREGQTNHRLTGRVKGLSRALERRGVTRLIVERGFPCPEPLSHWNRVETAPFYRSVGDLLALEYLKCKGKTPVTSVVRLSAVRGCSELMQTAKKLSAHVKGIAVDIPGEGATYASWLHRNFGIPMRQPGEGDVTLLFSGVDEDREGIIRLWGEEPYLSGLEVTAPGLTGLDHSDDRILAALWECGSLNRDSIRIEKRKTLDKSV